MEPKKREHIINYLPHSWQFWVVFAKTHDKKVTYSIEPIISFNLVENFAQYFHSLPKISELPYNQNNRITIAFFKDKVKPAWEDGPNQNGGSFSIILTYENGRSKYVPKEEPKEELTIELNAKTLGEEEKKEEKKKEEKKEENYNTVVDQIWKDLLVYASSGEIDKWLLNVDKVDENSDFDLMGVTVTPKHSAYQFELWTKSDYSVDTKNGHQVPHQIYQKLSSFFQKYNHSGKVSFKKHGNQKNKKTKN